jgi:hypothetical protein
MEVIPEPFPAVFILVTVDTEIFPIRTISGIIGMIPVFMMNGEQVTVFFFEFSAALGANQAVYLQGLLPVTLPGLRLPFQPFDDFIDRRPAGCFCTSLSLALVV